MKLRKIGITTSFILGALLLVLGKWTSTPQAKAAVEPAVKAGKIQAVNLTSEKATVSFKASIKSLAPKVCCWKCPEVETPPTCSLRG